MRGRERRLMNRRSFLRLVGVVGSGVTLGFPEAFGAGGDAASSGGEAATFGPTGLALADDGWRLWLDRSAAWKEDAIFFPSGGRLAQRPVHPPTGGWSALGADAGRGVTLPATAEQFYWGATGFRPYRDEYKFETSDDEVRNG